MKCSVCKKEITPAADHVAAEGKFFCDQAIPCANCSKNYREAGECTAGTAYELEGSRQNATLNASGSYIEITPCDVCGKEISRKTVVLAQLTGAAAEIEGYYYETLSKALEEAAKGDTIKLNKNSVGAGLNITKDITIDFNGFNYTVNAPAANGAAVQIAEGVVVSFESETTGKLQTLYGERAQFKNLIVNNGTLTTKNVTLRGDILGAEGETATIVNNGTLTLNVGTVVNAVKTALEGTENVTKDASVKLDAPEGFCWSGDTTLKAHNYSNTETVIATANAGGYTKHICECGAYYIDNIVWRLDAFAVNVTTGVRYETLAEAVKFAENGQTVKLLQNFVGDALEVNANIIIDLDGKNYTADTAKSGAAVVVAEGVNAEICNGLVQIRWTSRDKFDCLVENNGTLTANNVILKATNAFAEGAVAVKGSGDLLGNPDIINP